ncbi:unnamed protein product [Camellia sinensis]
MTIRARGDLLKVTREEDPHEVLQRSKRSNREKKENITSISNDKIQRKENSDSEEHFEHAFEGVSNRRKSLVLNEDLEGQIKGLYEKSEISWRDAKYSQRIQELSFFKFFFSFFNICNHS